MAGIAVVGGGTMGATFIRAVTAARLTNLDELTVCESLPERRQWLTSEFDGIGVTSDFAEAADDADVIYLSVKPQDLSSLRPGLLDERQLAISILAGSTMASVREALGHERIVRAMPNTPAQIGRGLTVWTAADCVTAGERARTQQLLGAMGVEIYAADESVIDKATAVNGSGPAYVFLLIEAMINGAVTIGLRPDEARRMVLETVIGSAEFVSQSGEHPAVLRDMVTSPGGTTAAGVRVLEDRAVRAAMIEAIAAAHARAEELGRG